MSKIAHIEFAGVGGERLRSFYRDLFGWPLRKDEAGNEYWRAELAPARGLTVGVRHEPEGHAEVVPYFRVDDVRACAARAEQLGGSVRIAPIDMPQFTFCVVRDPEGNSVGLVQPTVEP